MTLKESENKQMHWILAAVDSPIFMVMAAQFLGSVQFNTSFLHKEETRLVECKFTYASICVCMQTKALCPMTVSLDPGFPYFELSILSNFWLWSTVSVYFSEKSHSKFYVKDYIVNVSIEIKIHFKNKHYSTIIHTYFDGIFSIILIPPSTEHLIKSSYYLKVILRLVAEIFYYWFGLVLLLGWDRILLYSPGFP